MKKLFVSAMAAVIAFGSVNALAASMLLEYNDIKVYGNDTMTREEMLRMPNDVQKAELERKRQEELARKQAELAAQQAAAGVVAEQPVVEEVVVEQPKEEPVKQDSFDRLARLFGGVPRDSYASKKIGSTGLTGILEGLN